MLNCANADADLALIFSALHSKRFQTDMLSEIFLSACFICTLGGSVTSEPNSAENSNWKIRKCLASQLLNIHHAWSSMFKISFFGLGKWIFYQLTTNAEVNVCWEGMENAAQCPSAKLNLKIIRTGFQKWCHLKIKCNGLEVLWIKFLGWDVHFGKTQDILGRKLNRAIIACSKPLKWIKCRTF